jgi:molybdopterin-containing oxidoreductase family iron-sulfur binding subunit
VSAEHWRSLGELEASAESRAFREREFPEGASEPPEGVSRRTVLTLLGASGRRGLAGRVPAAGGAHRPVRRGPEQIMPGVPRHYATTMPNGTSAYGLVVESHEGRPTKLEGNELHPASLGASSAACKAAVLDLYDPDRSQQVLKRGEPSSWTDFVAAWKERAKLHAADGGETLAIVATALGLAHARAPARRASRRRTRRRASSATRPCRRRTRSPASRAPRPRAAARPPPRQGEGDPRDRRRPAARRPGDDPAHARLRGRPPRLGARRRHEPAVGGRSRLLDHRRQRDHRLRLPARLIRASCALAAELKKGGLAIDGRPRLPRCRPGRGLAPRAGRGPAREQGHVRDRGGPRQPAAVHAAVVALNAALGNVPATVEYREPTDALLPSPAAFAELGSALRDGKVKTLVVLGANPAYDAPADLDWKARAAKAEELVPLRQPRRRDGVRSRRGTSRARTSSSPGATRARAAAR